MGARHRVATTEGLVLLEISGQYTHVGSATPVTVRMYVSWYGPPASAISAIASPLSLATLEEIDISVTSTPGSSSLSQSLTLSPALSLLHNGILGNRARSRRTTLWRGALSYFTQTLSALAQALHVGATFIGIDLTNIFCLRAPAFLLESLLQTARG